MAAKTQVPSANVFAKPANLTLDEAAALGTSWLTAYSLVFASAGVKPGDTILIQGQAAACRPLPFSSPTPPGWRCSSPRATRPSASVHCLGADAAFEAGARLPRKVDAVIESVGAATWGHSVRSVRPGGTIAICGATTGDQPGAELTRVFFQDIRVQGNTMGSREDFARLLRFVEHADIHPVIDSTFGLADARAAFAKALSGDVFGKVVVRI